mmetsp:Transcript_2535/g.6859  ORF Transcript_2535/g.6859 Transcript_2535/m.6859 type:complete len:252 (+) Transcript_2535:808-1563(+)
MLLHIHTRMCYRRFSPRVRHPRGKFVPAVEFRNDRMDPKIDRQLLRRGVAGGEPRSGNVGVLVLRLGGRVRRHGSRRTTRERRRRWRRGRSGDRIRNGGLLLLQFRWSPPRTAGLRRSDVFAERGGRRGGRCSGANGRGRHDRRETNLHGRALERMHGGIVDGRGAQRHGRRRVLPRTGFDQPLSERLRSGPDLVGSRENGRDRPLQRCVPGRCGSPQVQPRRGANERFDRSRERLHRDVIERRGGQNSDG